MEARKENKMGIQPVGKLLVAMSLPVMVSMLIQALYNIVDSVFVSRISENALTAVSLAFPIQNLIIAVAVGTGVGINSLLSRRLGERNFEDANAAAENGIMLAVLSWIVFAIVCGLFSDDFFRMFTSNPEIVEMGTQYLSVCCVFSFGCFLQLATERIMQATGVAIFNMITQGIGAITNIILDPILIFGLLGMPKMGVKGAAVATVAGQILAMALGLLFNHLFNHEVRMNFLKFRPNWRIVREIYKVGVPSIVMQSIATLMTGGMNKILIVFSETAVSVFGIYFKLQSFVFMPVFGLTNGLIPIVAYNFGAGKKERIIKAIRLACIYALAIMLAGMIAFIAFPAQMIGMFASSEESLGAMVAIGVPALRLISLSFLGAAVGIVLSSVFQAVGNGMYSLIMSLTRQLAILLPVAWVMARFVSLDAVWLAFPIAEMVSLCLALVMYRRIYHRQISTLKTTP